MKNHLRGFTLIELLVVIAIIGLLSAIVLASLGTARDKARTAKFVGEIKQFQNALELYKSEHSHYPSAAGGLVCSADSCEINEDSVPGLIPQLYPGSNGSAPIPWEGYYSYISVEGSDDNWENIIGTDNIKCGENGTSIPNSSNNGYWLYFVTSQSGSAFPQSYYNNNPLPDEYCIYVP